MATSTTITLRCPTCGTSVRRCVNEARIGYTNQMNFFSDPTLGKGYAGATRMAVCQGGRLSRVSKRPVPTLTRWLTPGTNAVYKEHVFDYSDVVTMIRGKHILHFGGELLAYRDNSTAWGNQIAGNMQYSGQYTKQYTVDSAYAVQSHNGAAMHGSRNRLRVRGLPSWATSTTGPRSPVLSMARA